MHLPFVYIVGLLIIAIAVHCVAAQRRTSERIAELVLLYLLIGYCGIPGGAIGLWAVINPSAAAAAFGFPMGPAFLFMGFALVGMSACALVTLRYRGTALIPPVVVWATFLSGATLAHIARSSANGHLSHRGVIQIVATHGFIALLLVISLAFSRVWQFRDAGNRVV